MRLTRPCATNASGKRKLSGGAALKQHAAQLAQLPQTCSASIAAGSSALPKVGTKPSCGCKLFTKETEYSWAKFAGDG